MINDYLLIYLYRETGEEEILEKIVDKYKNLIYKNIQSFYISNKDKEDFYQEGVLMLIHAIKTFNEEYNKTFTKYFELILIRKFIQLKKSVSNYILCESVELIEGSYEMHFDYLNEDVYLTKYETLIRDLYFNQRYTIKNIAIEVKRSEKSVKNAIYRVKKKLEI